MLTNITQQSTNQIYAFCHGSRPLGKLGKLAAFVCQKRISENPKWLTWSQVGDSDMKTRYICLTCLHYAASNTDNKWLHNRFKNMWTVLPLRVDLELNPHNTISRLTDHSPHTAFLFIRSRPRNPVSSNLNCTKCSVINRKGFVLRHREFYRTLILGNSRKMYVKLKQIPSYSSFIISSCSSPQISSNFLLKIH